MIWFRVLADLIVVVHALFVAFVVLGLGVILIGVALHWGWVRNFWFRLAHLAAIGFVVLEAAVGMVCPLTAWESRLRLAAGQEPYPGDFIGYWAHRLIFYEAEPWVFTAVHSVFGLAVLAAFLLAPPNPPRPSNGHLINNSNKEGSPPSRGDSPA